MSDPNASEWTPQRLQAHCGWTTSLARSILAHAGSVALLLVGTLLVACSSTSRSSNRVANGEACRIDFHNVRSNRTMSIVNQSYGADVERDGSVSRVEDEVVSILIQDFENLGFFQRAMPTVPANAGDWLAIRTPRSIWVSTKPNDATGRTTWSNFATGFTAVWNTGERFVTQKGYGSGRERLEAEQEKLQRRNTVLDRLRGSR